MHLCSNVLLGKLLPAGILVRRNFSFQAEEKSLGNRLYRQVVDWLLARKHNVVDFLFALAPINSPGRLRRIVALAREYAVEVETHPIVPDEHWFLTGGEVFRWADGCPIAQGFTMGLKWHS